MLLFQWWLSFIVCHSKKTALSRTVCSLEDSGRTFSWLVCYFKACCVSLIHTFCCVVERSRWASPFQITFALNLRWSRLFPFSGHLLLHFSAGSHWEFSATGLLLDCAGGGGGTMHWNNNICPLFHRLLADSLCSWSWASLAFGIYCPLCVCALVVLLVTTLRENVCWWREMLVIYLWLQTLTDHDQLFICSVPDWKQRKLVRVCMLKKENMQTLTDFLLLLLFVPCCGCCCCLCKSSTLAY